MRNKNLTYFLLFILIAPVFVSFYNSIEKERGKKKAVISFVMDEEEQEEEEEAEKEGEKWGKEKQYHHSLTDIEFYFQIQQEIQFFYLTSKVLMPYTNLLTPPPKIS